MLSLTYQPWFRVSRRTLRVGITLLSSLKESHPPISPQVQLRLRLSLRILRIFLTCFITQSSSSTPGVVAAEATNLPGLEPFGLHLRSPSPVSSETTDPPGLPSPVHSFLLRFVPTNYGLPCNHEGSAPYGESADLRIFIGPSTSKGAAGHMEPRNYCSTSLGAGVLDARSTQKRF